jgi:hypothetical protein
VQFADIQAQLNDLPTTFKRHGAPYTQLIDALSGGLTGFTVGVDGVIAQTAAFQLAQGGWLDLWGLLFLVPRSANEGDGPYETRIAETVLAWVATMPAIQAWLNLFAPGGTVTEGLPSVGYSLILPATMSPSDIVNFLIAFNRIRPAGVPFTVQQSAGGLYLGTVAFMGLGRVQGNYLTEATGQQALNVASVTNNARPMIPSLFLVDPSINGLV